MTALGCSLKWFSSIDGIKRGKHASRFFFIISKKHRVRILLLLSPVLVFCPVHREVTFT